MLEATGMTRSSLLLKGPSKVIADAICVSHSLSSVNLLKNNFDVETATMFATISKKKKR